MTRRASIPVRVAPSELPQEGVSAEQADAKPQVPEPAAEAPTPDVAEDVEMWRDRALRLEAEMDNYRKRQRRLAEERIAEERDRLLRRLISLADDVERALSAERADAASLRQGVQLTHRSLVQALAQEGVEPIEAKGKPFDPEWHEASGAFPGERVGVEPGRVIEVMQKGYCVGDRLLRPARVIVAA
jgi:molecular chaperone GrpE